MQSATCCVSIRDILTLRVIDIKFLLVLKYQRLIKQSGHEN